MLERPARGEKPPRQQRLVTALPTVAAVLLVAAVVVTATPQAVMTVPVVERASSFVAQVLPQGWSFFTKPPQTPRYRLLTSEDDGLRDVLASHSVDASVVFGLHRGFRNVAAEREMVERHLADETLVACPSGAVAQCVRGLDISHPLHTMTTSVRQPRLCGTFYVTAADPVPWAWRDLVEGTVRTTHVTTLAIICPPR